MISPEYLEGKEPAERTAGMDERLSGYEKTIFFVLFCIPISLLLVAIWSGILLLGGEISGGGPLGLLIQILPLHLLL